MSLTPEMLDEEHRKLRADFFGDVFGFFDIPMMTIDRKRQVFQVHNIEQFVFLIADDERLGDGVPAPRPLRAVGGRGVGARRDPRPRAEQWQARDDRVDIIDKKVDDHGMLAITSIYVRYLLPMMCEIQWWDYHDPDRADPARSPEEHRQGTRDRAVAVGRVRAAGLEARVQRAGRRPTRGTAPRSSRSSPSSSAITTSGCTTTSRRCRAASPRTCSRRSRRSPRSRSTRRRSSSGRW